MLRAGVSIIAQSQLVFSQLLCIITTYRSLKVVLERESIRTLCDKLRRERDRAVSELAEALRDSDEGKKLRNETAKENKELRQVENCYFFGCCRKCKVGCHFKVLRPRRHLKCISSLKIPVGIFSSVFASIK